LENLKLRLHLEDQDVDGMIILTMDLGGRDGRTYTELNCNIIGPSGGLL
jgi:hypothetical protein